SDGLTGALRKHAEVLTRAYGVPVTVADTRPPGAPGPGADAERPLWRVAQEALSNALRHAGASAVSVTVEADGPGGGTRLSVADDGGGFDPDARSIAARRLGLVSMRERIESVGGSLEIVSARRRRPRGDRPHPGRRPGRPDPGADELRLRRPGAPGPAGRCRRLPAEGRRSGRGGGGHPGRAPRRGSPRPGGDGHGPGRGGPPGRGR